MDYHERIVYDPVICSGQPVIRGTRVLVRIKLDENAGGNAGGNAGENERADLTTLTERRGFVAPVVRLSQLGDR